MYMYTVSKYLIASFTTYTTIFRYNIIIYNQRIYSTIYCPLYIVNNNNGTWMSNKNFIYSNGWWKQRATMITNTPKPPSHCPLWTTKRYPFCNLVQICLETLRNFSLGLLDSKCTKVHNNELKFTVQSIRCPGRVDTSLSASTTRPWPTDISANSAVSLRQSALKSNKKTYHGIAENFYANLSSM